MKLFGLSQGLLLGQETFEKSRIQVSHLGKGALKDKGNEEAGKLYPQHPLVDVMQLSCAFHDQTHQRLCHVRGQGVNERNLNPYGG